MDFYLKRSALYSSKQMKDTCNFIREQLSCDSDLLIFDYIAIKHSHAEKFLSNIPMGGEGQLLMLKCEKYEL